MRNIFDQDYEKLLEFLTNIGEKRFRTEQIWEGLYKHYYENWQNFSTLPADLRTVLQKEYNISSLVPVNSQESKGGLSRKTQFELPDQSYIETVLLKGSGRLTLCISTQVGCSVHCKFCATGSLGFTRNLTSGEIIEQVIYFSRKLNEQNHSLTNIVFMGMGEPFLNYDNSLNAVRRINDQSGLNFGARRITISTIGITDKIIAFAQEGLQINLAISLHASNNHLRQLLIPVSSHYPLNNLLDACKYYFKLTRRRITFEYVMIEGVNDASESALELSYLLRDLTCHVNLIPLNSIKDYDGHSPARQAIEDFGKILINHGIPISIRQSLGSEIHAGCGQLAGVKSQET